MSRLTRRVFQQLAEERLREADLLLKAGKASGASYLGGYAVECALKACIAKKASAEEFPPSPQQVKDGYYTHVLTKLLKTAELERELDEAEQARPEFNVNWAVVLHWGEESRYELVELKRARELYEAIADPNHGVLEWLRQHW